MAFRIANSKPHFLSLNHIELTLNILDAAEDIFQICKLKKRIS